MIVIDPEKLSKVGEDLTAKQAAEKLDSLKGAGFSPPVSY